MKPEAQRIEIAEWCGWTDIIFRGITDQNDYVGRHDSCRPAGATGLWQGPIPDYLNDLKAMWEAEATVFNKKDWSRYTDILCDQVQSKSESPIRATAAQRAEALLRTIGKWEDDK